MQLAYQRYSLTELYEELDGQNNVIEFDFLGKDSIRYYNKVTVDPQVFKNVKLFMKGKVPGDDLFDRLNVRNKCMLYQSI